jgi:hypothetical protein
VQSALGCDSIVTTTLTINPLPNATVTQTGATFSAQPGYSYQWLNCLTNQPITGETNQNFTAVSNGHYAAIVSNGMCIDTSICFIVNNIGLNEVFLPQVNLYPNPTSGLLKIESKLPWQRAEVADILGRILITQPEQKEELDFSNLPTGIYLVKIFFDERFEVHRIVRE